jgi:hypothetical protein
MAQDSMGKDNNGEVYPNDLGHRSRTYLGLETTDYEPLTVIFNRIKYGESKDRFFKWKKIWLDLNILSKEEQVQWYEIISDFKSAKSEFEKIMIEQYIDIKFSEYKGRTKS